MFYLAWLLLVLVLVMHFHFEKNLETFDDTKKAKIAIATMVSEQPDFDEWIRHHLNVIGVDRIYLRIENTPQIVAIAAQYPIRFITKWADDGGAIKKNNYFAQMDRQGDFVNRMIQKAKNEDGIDFLFHIDADELIRTSRSLSDVLREVPGHYACIHMKNFEAQYNGDTQSCFKSAGFLDCTKDACTSYANGKSGAVLKNNPRYHGPHYFHGALYDIPANELCILHYDSCTFDQWKSKFTRMKETDPAKVANFPFYKESIEMIRSGKPDAELLQFYQQRKHEKQKR